MTLTISTALFNIVVASSWREEMELEKINLLGHSFGGYLSPSSIIHHHRSLSIIIQVLESWREGMELEKIHLLGHSFGGYLTAHYK